jgi:hypothetical protein
MSPPSAPKAFVGASSSIRKSKVSNGSSASSNGAFFASRNGSSTVAKACCSAGLTSAEAEGSLSFTPASASFVSFSGCAASNKTASTFSSSSPDSEGATGTRATCSEGEAA